MTSLALELEILGMTADLAQIAARDLGAVLATLPADLDDEDVTDA